MKILVIGSGGREDALVWKISQSLKVSKIYCAPGNAGTSKRAQNIDIKSDDLQGLFKFAKDNKIDLTVVGPEVPLVLGIVDLFEKEGLRVFGPNKLAARMEGSKIFAKELMEKYSIPTAKYKSFTDEKSALDFINSIATPMVIKADGLAAGKGVIICQTKDEAVAAVKRILGDKEFGSAGSSIVIEEFLEGEEASILCFTDGKTIVPMDSAQDHKRVFDNDEGSNTGGMGAYSPAPVVTKELLEVIDKTILKPTIEGLVKDGITYKGVLYVGVIVTKDGSKVLEYNARFGDPETQCILPRLKNDIVDVFEAIIDSNLANIKLLWEEKASVCLVLASGGYPGKYQNGIEINGIEKASQLEDVVVFHAGTAIDQISGKVITNGGRVLNVVANGKTIKEAIDLAYQATTLISFEGMHYRKDIGLRALRE